MKKSFEQEINYYENEPENDDSQGINLVDMAIEDPAFYIKLNQYVSKLNMEQSYDFVQRAIVSLISDVAEGYWDQSWPTYPNADLMDIKDAQLEWDKLKAAHLNLLKSMKNNLPGYGVITDLVERLWYSEVRRILDNN